MATRIVEGKLPYTGGTGIGIDTNKVISLLLREENNLIHVNDDNEVYTDLQLVANITPSSEFPVGVTVGKVLQTDGWTQNGLLLNRKTTSGDYARWLYGADGELYFDGGQGTWKQVYYSDEVLALFTQLRGELATVAFSGDYNDLINRPAFLQEQADWDQTDTDAPDYIKNKPTIPTVNDATLTIQKNGTAVATFTANSSTNATANITVPNVINNVTSTSTSDALSANQGKLLQDQIDDLKAMGRFLSLWDCETGMPISFPLSTPYNYQTGDYFLVENVDTTTNYRPNGVQYTGTASTTLETDEVEVGDLYIYDGAVWLLQINHGKSVSFANLAGQPSDNAALASALNSKANKEDVNVKVFHVASTSDITNAQAAIDWWEQGRLTGGYTPLIEFGGGKELYGLLGITDGFEALFTSLAPEETQGTSKTTTTIKQVVFSLTGTPGQPQTVTAISTGNYLSANYLDTSASYSSPYTPSNPGSPATKKYVDDNKVTATSQLTNDSGYITSAYHDSSKQDALTAGTGIDITSNTISTTNNFGTSSTAAATVQKEVSIPGIKTLNVGQVVHILPSTTSTVANSTLKVNNFTAYPMRYNNAAITTTTDSQVRPANIVTSFVFDGTYWQFIGHGLDNNTTYSAMTTSEATTGTSTSARTISASVLKGAIKTHAPVTSVNGQTGDVVFNAGEGIEIKDFDYSAMQGPASDGFHLPSKDEWVALRGILINTFYMAANATTMGTYLKMPMAGYRLYSSSSVDSLGSFGGYWSSTAYSTEKAYALFFGSSTLNPQNSYSRAYGQSIRCFKDVPVTPDGSWTTLYDGSSVATGAGVFYNATDGLISISGDGATWYTIQDKNLGATTVYNQGDALTDANCGYFYQWGNNYGFAHSGNVTTSSTQVDASSYGPGNYYSSSTFITRISSPYDWSSVQNDNLWGGVTGVLKNAITNTGIAVDPSSPIQLTKIWAGTQAQYEALSSYDSTTVYLTI